MKSSGKCFGIGLTVYWLISYNLRDVNVLGNEVADISINDCFNL